MPCHVVLTSRFGDQTLPDYPQFVVAFPEGIRLRCSIFYFMKGKGSCERVFVRKSLPWVGRWRPSKKQNLQRLRPTFLHMIRGKKSSIIEGIETLTGDLAGQSWKVLTSIL
jgi:hypothetical protein